MPRIFFVFSAVNVVAEVGVDVDLDVDVDVDVDMDVSELVMAVVSNQDKK